jgi:hypothetical protein
MGLEMVPPMKILHDRFDRAVTIRFENSFGVREAISLPALIKPLPQQAVVTLDFSEVQWLRESALAALIPALNSLHGRKVTVCGLEDVSGELAALPIAA